MTKSLSPTITDTQRLDLILNLLQKGGTNLLTSTLNWDACVGSPNRDDIDAAIRQERETDREEADRTIADCRTKIAYYHQVIENVQNRIREELS